MWGLIVSGIGGIFEAWLGAKKARYEAEKNFELRKAEMEETWDLIALRQAQFSWKDEFITVIIFWPLIAWWFPALRPEALAWAEFVGTMPLWYQIVMFGIIAASFGLRWWFKQQNLKVNGNG